MRIVAVSGTAGYNRTIGTAEEVRAVANQNPEVVSDLSDLRKKRVADACKDFRRALNNLGIPDEALMDLSGVGWVDSIDVVKVFAIDYLNNGIRPR